MGLHPLLMVDVRVYHNQRDWISVLVDVNVYCTVNKTRLGLHPLLMVDVKVYYSQQEWV